MKLAVLADVHANLEALEAVLADLGDWPDRIVVAGDLIGYGPDPNAVVERLRNLGATCIWGNHEGMLLGRLGLKNCIYAGIKAVLWTRGVLHPDNRLWLEALPFSADVAPGIHLVHADPRDPEKYVETAALANDAFASVSPGIRVLIAGHTHQPILGSDGAWIRPTPGSHPLGRRVWLNPGAVGQSRDEFTVARYARLDLTTESVSFHEVEYFWQQTAQKMSAAGLVPLLCASHSGPAQRIIDAVRTRWLRWTTR
jgi:predicted phosphodiesterase